MFIKISLIVPVYKAEHYLRRCVDSLLAQTFSDYEILLVDDGSPDASGTMCDEYARQDSRIRSYHKENGGVSSARQFGIEHARGEYIIHADPDDWVEPNMLAELYAKAKETDADMVICDFYNHERGKISLVSQKPSSLQSETVLCELFYRLHGSCCNKLVRRACFDNFHVSYPLDLSYCEDLYVNACLLSKNIEVSYLPKAFYHYDQDINANSLVHRPVKFVLSQGTVFAERLKQKLPSHLFSKVYPYWRYKMALVVLLSGEFGIDTFTEDFKDLRSYVNKIHISMVRKLVLLIALYVSPQLARAIYVLRMRM